MSPQVAPRIKGKMMEIGSAMIGYQPLGAKVNFFRCVLSNPATQKEDIDFLLDEIIGLGQDLWGKECIDEKLCDGVKLHQILIVNIEFHLP